MYSQGNVPLGGLGRPSTSSRHETSAVGSPPPAPPLPLEELEEDEPPPEPLEEEVLVFCAGSSEHPHRQATVVAKKSQRFITAPSG